MGQFQKIFLLFLILFFSVNFTLARQNIGCAELEIAGRIYYFGDCENEGTQKNANNNTEVQAKKGLTKSDSEKEENIQNSYVDSDTPIQSVPRNNTASPIVNNLPAPVLQSQPRLAPIPTYTRQQAVSNSQIGPQLSQPINTNLGPGYATQPTSQTRFFNNSNILNELLGSSGNTNFGNTGNTTPPRVKTASLDSGVGIPDSKVSPTPTLQKNPESNSSAEKTRPESGLQAGGQTGGVQVPQSANAVIPNPEETGNVPNPNTFNLGKGLSPEEENNVLISTGVGSTPMSIPSDFYGRPDVQDVTENQSTPHNVSEQTTGIINPYAAPSDLKGRAAPMYDEKLNTASDNQTEDKRYFGGTPIYDRWTRIFERKETEEKIKDKPVGESFACRNFKSITEIAFGSGACRNTPELVNPEELEKANKENRKAQLEPRRIGDKNENVEKGRDEEIDKNKNGLGGKSTDVVNCTYLVKPYTLEVVKDTKDKYSHVSYTSFVKDKSGKSREKQEIPFFQPRAEPKGKNQIKFEKKDEDYVADNTKKGGEKPAGLEPIDKKKTPYFCCTSSAQKKKIVKDGKEVLTEVCSDVPKNSADSVGYLSGMKSQKI